MSFRDNREPKLVEIKKEIQLNKQNNNSWSDSKSRQLIQNHAKDPDLPYPINEIEDKIVAPDFNTQVNQSQSVLAQFNNELSVLKREEGLLINALASSKSRSDYNRLTAKRQEIKFKNEEISNENFHLDLLNNEWNAIQTQSVYDDSSIDLVEKDVKAKMDLFLQSSNSVEQGQVQASLDLALLHESWVKEDFLELDKQLIDYKQNLTSNFSKNNPNIPVPSDLLETNVKEKEKAYNNECKKHLDANGNLVCSKDELKEITRLKEEAQIARTFYNYDSKDYEAISNRFDEYECNLALKEQASAESAVLLKQDDINKKGKGATPQDISDLQNLEYNRNALNDYILYLQGVNSFVANSTPAPGQPGPTPAPGQPGPTPAPGQPGPTPAPGQPGPAPAPGQPGQDSGNFFVRGVKKAANFVRKHKVQTAFVVGYLAYKGYNHYSDGVFRNNVMNGFSNMDDRFNALNFNMTNHSAQLSDQMQKGFDGINNNIVGVGRQVEGVSGMVNSNADSLSALSKQVSNIKPSINVNMQTVVQQQQRMGVIKTPSIPPKDLPKIDPKQVKEYVQATKTLEIKCLPDELIAKQLKDAKDLLNK